MSTNELNTGVTTESWRPDLLARAEEARRRRAARQQQRRLAAARRAHGMVERNAARLAEARRRSRAGP